MGKTDVCVVLMQTCRSSLGICWSPGSLVMRQKVSRLRRTILATMLGTRDLCSVLLCRRLFRISRRLCLENKMIEIRLNQEKHKSTEP
jgi:hypothetical protein